MHKHISIKSYLLFVLCVVVAIPQSGFGQTEPDVKNPEKKPVRSIATVTSAAKAKPKLDKSSLQTAARLVAASRSAFVRGLMPVADYAERLSAARQLELAATDALDQRARLAIQQRHIGYWTEAVERIRRFRQPASQGWAADVSFAEMMQAASESYVAKESGNAALYRATTNRRAAFAQQQFDRRLADLDIGRASLSQLAESLSQLRQTATDAESAELKPDTRLTIIRRVRVAANILQARVQLLEEQPAGVSRQDALQRIQYEVSMAAANATFHTESNVEFVSNVTVAYRAAQRMSSTQQTAYRDGTASLADLTRSWRLKQDAVDRLNSRDDIRRPSALDAHMKDELTRLSGLAGSIKDRRGRNEADILFVSSLSTLQNWKAMQGDKQAAVKANP